MTTITKTHVAFTSDLFPVAAFVESSDFQPGKECAEYLRDQIAHRNSGVVDATTYYEEDSWNVFFTMNDRVYCVNLFCWPYEPEDQKNGHFNWILRCFPSRRFFERLLGRHPPPEIEFANSIAVRAIIESDERIWDVKWMTEEEYDRYVRMR